jgi:hypothetical protein
MAKKRVKALLTIRVSLTPGVCRWCQCTYDRPCANGCGWVERTQTLCSECVPLDKALQTKAGRRQLAEFIQEHVEGLAMPVPENVRARR